MKVLVVDDNIAIQEILKDILIEDGQIVRIAGTIDDAVDAILQTLLRRDIGLEINTGSLRRNYPETNPSAAIAARYYELGGRLITIASDAHYAEHVAADFDRAEAMLREIGFTEYATFSGGVPKFHKF